jgi:glycogen synthase
MTRILFLSPAYPPLPGGGERYAKALANQLAERGYAVTVLTSHAQHEQQLWRGAGSQPHQTQEGKVTVIRLPLRPFPGGRTGLLAWRKLMVLLSALPGDQSRLLGHMARLIPPIVGLEDALATLPVQVDLVHAFNISWEWPLWAGWQWAQKHGLPFVATPFMHFGTGHDRVALNATMDHQRQLLLGAKRLLVLTAVEQTGLLALGVERERVAVIGGGVDSVVTAVDDTDDLRGQYGLSSRYALFLGRVSYDKGAIHAAQAVLALTAQDIDITLGLIGQPAPEFTRFYDNLTPAEQTRIRPFGILDENAKHGLLAGAEALLLPSRTDSFGIVLLEAWLHGVPVIAARAGGIPGVVDDGVNGLLVPFGDIPALSGALHRLLAEPNLRQQLGEQGKAKATTVYTWERVADSVAQQYTAILKA